MKQQFKDLLHRYKVEAFKVSHHNDDAHETASEILRFTEQALNNEYHYHFHHDQDPRRIETFKMIKNYTLEALLPPVVEKLVRRISILEKQHTELVRLIDNILETMSDERARLDPPSRA